MLASRRHFLATSGTSAVAIALSPSLAFAQSDADAALYRVMDTIVRGDLMLAPESMTGLGLDTGALAAMRMRLDDYGAAGEAAHLAHNRKALAALQAFDPAGLSELAAVRLRIATDMVAKRLVPARFDIGSVGAPYRITQRKGAYFSVPDFLGAQHPVASADDAEAYLSRLAAFPFALDDEAALQREEAARGYAAPDWSLAIVEDQLRTQLEPAPADSPMVANLTDRTEKAGIAGDWRTRAARIVDEDVYPALSRYLSMVQKVRAKTRPGDGLWRVPRGDEIYAEALKYYTTTDMSADEIHEIGLRQVAELSARLEPMLAVEGLTGATIGAKLAQLNARKDQLYANTDEGRAALIESLVAGNAAMQAKLGDAFATLPAQPMEVRRVPVEIQDGAPNGYYYRASLDGSRPAIYWINLKDTADWPKYTLPSLTYHEGVPGHHLHLSLIQQDEGLPLLLKRNFISAHSEGWALYAEMVAEELNGYQGLEEAGALQSWLFRAARLVVDTGIHAKRWSREKATQYFIDNVGFTPRRSQSEIERYCVTPGQACSYKIGQNVWVDLRARAERELGEGFELRRFHEILREGIMPLNLLSERIGDWIAREKARLGR
ncbi:DUF885 domain-containing protein [Croceicoccus naphthovorans]|uniref:Tat pathway signal protein n=1 Tax=Croceicoccus naphthovorans TaxID=1348774 RepID=A0A0G3XJ48_9SPHN|nr:DUF885 family protein [Croceicoccus naphthovorans]AKM10636.1 hypothetical protein AB433_12755 [Croceicoccus naphthovorans]